MIHCWAPEDAPLKVHLISIGLSLEANGIPLRCPCGSHRVSLGHPLYSHTIIPLSHPSHTLLIPLSYFSHTPLIPLSYPSHTLLIPFSYPSHTPLILFSYLSHTLVIPLSLVPLFAFLKATLHSRVHNSNGALGRAPNGRPLLCCRCVGMCATLTARV